MGPSEVMTEAADNDAGVMNGDGDDNLASNDDNLPTNDETLIMSSSR